MPKYVMAVFKMSGAKGGDLWRAYNRGWTETWPGFLGKYVVEATNGTEARRLAILIAKKEESGVLQEGDQER